MKDTPNKQKSEELLKEPQLTLKRLISLLGIIFRSIRLMLLLTMRTNAVNTLTYVYFLIVIV